MTSETSSLPAHVAGSLDEGPVEFGARSVVVDDMPPVRPTVRDTAATPCTRHLANDRRSLGRLTEILVGFLEPSSVPVKHLVAVRRHVLVMLVPQLLVPKNVTGT